jgi:hypothetical protein
MYCNKGAWPNGIRYVLRDAVELMPCAVRMRVQGTVGAMVSVGCPGYAGYNVYVVLLFQLKVFKAKLMPQCQEGSIVQAHLDWLFFSTKQGEDQSRCNLQYSHGIAKPPTNNRMLDSPAV